MLPITNDNKSNYPQCKHCKLYIEPKYMHPSNLCRMCYNYGSIVNIFRSLGSFTMINMLLGLVLIFIPSLRIVGFILFLLAIIPTAIVNTFQPKIVYRKIPIEGKILHQLRFFDIVNENKFYYEALKLAKKEKNKTDDFVKAILDELTESILLSDKFTPENLVSDWCEALGITTDEFIDYIFTNTNILEGFGYEKGAGLLPVVWQYIKNNEYKDKILTVLKNSCENLDNATEKEKTVFLEDLYLLDNELIDYIGSNAEWQIVIDTIKSFVPEEPPKNMLEAKMKKMQIQQQAQVKKLDNSPSINTVE